MLIKDINKFLKIMKLVLRNYFLLEKMFHNIIIKEIFYYKKKINF